MASNKLEEISELIRTSKSHRDIYIWRLLRGLRDGYHDIDFVYANIITLMEYRSKKDVTISGAE